MIAPGKRAAVAVAAAAVAAAAGCGSSAKPVSDSHGGSPGSTSKASAGAGAKAATKVTIGVLTDVTGLAASSNKTAIEGVKAGTFYASRQGFSVKYVVGDTESNPSIVLTAAQKMVTRDHVTAVIATSALTFAAAKYLTSRGIPVIGPAQDGPEWLTSTNMFPVFGALNTRRVSDGLGKFMKMQGVTTVGAIGYGISPTSSESAKSFAESNKHVGLKVGYLNASFPFGGTDVGPASLGMKAAGVDGFSAFTDPNTSFALVTALRQAGVDIKVALLPTGYGGDLLQAGPGALKAGQNVYFELEYTPVEMQTAATKQFQSDLSAAGVNGEPTYAMYNGYASVGLLVRALKATGGDSSAKALIAALSNVHDWDGLGLFGGQKVDINNRSASANGVNSCTWITKLVGQKFELVKGATPICGRLIPGLEVSPSS